MIEFLKTLAMSVSPFAYHNFCAKNSKEVSAYFVSVVVIGLILTNILLIPFYVGLPDMVHDSLSAFTKFNVTNDVQMSGPLEIPKKEAAFVIDTTGTIKEMKNERIIVTKDYVYYRMFFSNKRVSLEKLLNITENPSDTTWMIIAFLVFLLPSLLIYALVFIALKHLILILTTSLLLFFAVRVLMLYEISFKNAVSSSFYAGTLLVLIEAILYPINPKLLVPLISVAGLQFYLVSYLAFFIFGVLGLVFVEKDIRMPKRKHQEE